MPTDRLTRLRFQHAALQAKVRTATDTQRQQMLLAELIGVTTALERAEASAGDRPSNKKHRATVAARRAEAERNFAAALARYAPTHHAPASASAPRTSVPTPAAV